MIEPSNLTSIPRRMSFYFSSPVMTWLRWMSLYSFRKLHPAWEITLYTAGATIWPSPAKWESEEPQDADMPAGEYAGLNYWHCLQGLNINYVRWKPPGDLWSAPAVHQSDLCRWQVLSEFGGWYADTDILFTKPIDDLCADYCHNDLALIIADNWLPIGFLGARPNTRFFAEVYSRAVANYDASRYQCCGSEAALKVLGFESYRPTIDPLTKRRGPYIPTIPPATQLRAAIGEKFRDHAVTFLPTTSVYPWAWNEIDRIFLETEELPAGTVGIHWFGGAKLANRFNRVLTAENFRKFENTICREAGRLIDGG